MSNSLNIVVKYCSIQKSVGQALVLSRVSNDVIIECYSFLSNKQYRGRGTALHIILSITYVNISIIVMQEVWVILFLLSLTIYNIHL